VITAHLQQANAQPDAQTMSFQPTPGTAVEPPISNDGWFPDISVADLRAACRLDGTVTTERLTHAALGAILNVNQQLSAWRTAQQSAGVPDLESAPGPEVGGQPRALLLYRRAVYAATECELIERYRDFDTTAKGDKRAQDMATRIDDARRDLRWALTDLQGLRRSTVELI
jgi:hypothetical protein